MLMSDRPKHGSGHHRVRADAPQRLRDARVARGMTQDELGRQALGLLDKQAAFNAISRLERGEGSLTRYMDVAHFLGLTIMDVVEWVPT